jgi:sulfate transport system permease protein
MRRQILPGFTLSLSITLGYLLLLVIVPLIALVMKSFEGGLVAFLHAALAPRAIASYRISFGVSLLAALVNVLFGGIVAWVLTRYEFFGKGWVDAIVDLPFALPTAVAGLTFVALYSTKGPLGSALDSIGIKVAFAPLGILVVLSFVGLPFVVRTIQPVLEYLDASLEECAATLGATRWQTLSKVLFPQLIPAVLTGFALAFARAVGEYGSVVFISGNMPFRTEITPLLIVTKLEQYDYAGATALAIVMLAFSFAALLGINMVQRWHLRRRT